jgi:formylglycine-generating enzyme required for sulfatase activity
MGRNPSRGKPGPGEDTDRLPTDSVCWYDAVEFCNQLSAREGRTACYGLSNVRRAPNGTMRAADVTVRQGNGYRLPTEAEWEYACRTGTSGCRWHFGNDPSEAAKFGWFRENSSERTHPVGQKQPNAVGLYDMHGNVWEHCTDSGGLAAPGFRFTGRPRTDPLIRGTEEERIQRGGSFRWGPVRCAHRGCRYSPTTNFDDFGFRIVSDLYKPESAGVSQQRE